MKRLFEGTVHVVYSQVYVVAHPENLPDMDWCFEGQENGLCGASQPGVLFLITGLHTGSVAMTVDLCDSEPLMDDSWEEVVEVSFVTTSPWEPGISEWAGEGWHPLKFKRRSYRVRYCARHMESGRHKSIGSEIDESPDTYSLTFWHARVTKDRILKQTSETARNWHDWVRNRPPTEWEQLP
jgi:hypothetical protein